MKTPNSPSQVHGQTRYCVKILLCLFIFSSNYIFSQQIAFPEAEGFGKNASGGRGGIVIKVTNLNDDGIGSLRQALQYTSGTRTVIFEVGGTITLNSLLEITNGNVTIAGQTAPGGGILIKGEQVLVSSSNVIIRYLRFRIGNTINGQRDALGIVSWGNDIVENIIIDHCSLSWAEDENFNVRASANGAVKNITLQNSIISEAVYGSLAYKRTYNKTYYKNFISNTGERNITSNYPTDNTFDYEMINNLIYGVGGAGGNALGSKVTVLNNHYKNSSEQTMYPTIIDYRNSAENTNGQGTFSETYAFIAGNIIPSGTNEYSPNVIPYLKTTPYSTSGIVPIAASAIANDILSHVGASLPNRDAVDVRLINQYNANTGAVAYTGTYPTIANGPASLDTDNDGMPNIWEVANGLNPNNPNDRNIVQPDGYTNLEYFLNGMTLQSTDITANAGSDISLCSGNSTTLTATGGSSYLWSNGATTASITVSPSTTTTYTVTAYDSSGANSDSDDVIVTVKPMPAANAGGDVTTCQGTGVTLTATGGSSYLWSTGATTSSITVSPNNTTTYSVAVTQNGCTATDEVIVNVNTLPSVNAGTDVIINLGESATLTATGANSYIWSTDQTGATINVSPITTTIYTVTGENSNGCGATDTVKVTVLAGDPVNVNAGADVSICAGDSATLTASGGATYLWSNGATTATITVSPSSTTTYTVTAYDASGINSDTDYVIVSVNPLPSVNAGADVTINFGQSVTLTATGANIYTWNTEQTGESINVSPTSTTTYTVTGTNDNSCTATDSVRVTVLTGESVTANAGADVSICTGGSTTLTASGGATYLWNNGAITATISVSPTATTTYTVTAYDGSGINSDTDNVIVTVNSLPSVSAGTDVTITLGQSTNLTATGAESYVWSTEQTGDSINVSPTSTTTYTVIGLNSTNCSATDTVTVIVNAEDQTDQTDPINVNAGEDVSICAGENITLTATGGTTYLWSNGATTATITVSPNITTAYTIIAYDVSGINSDTDEVLVTVNPTPSVYAGSDVTINLGYGVSLKATDALNYLWSTGQTSQIINVTPTTTTTYSVSGTNNTGCSATDTVTVIVLTGESVSANAGEDISICEGSSTVLTATGGATYIWNNGATTASITVNPNITTTYTVTAYDLQGINSDSDSVLVTVNSLPNANAGSDVAICRGSSVTLNASGGDSYLWNNGATSSSITVSPNNTTEYSVEVTNNGCSDIDTVRVTVNPLPSVNAGTDVTINLGESVILNATGADNYVWNTQQIGAEINVSPLLTTTYTVIGTNNNGCTASDSITVTVLTVDQISVNAGIDVSICKGDSATLTATGGITYLWNNGATTATITVSPNTTTNYSVTGYDATGLNFATDDVDVTVNILPSVNAGEDVTINLGESIILNATGANSYIWSTEETGTSITVSPTTTTIYSVTGLNNTGCGAIDSVKVTVAAGETVPVNAGADVSICQGSSTTLVATGGSSYLWSTGATTASITVSPNTTTTYSVTAYDANDTVIGNDSVLITVNEAVHIVMSPDFTINFGQIVTLYAFGGTSYVWDNGQTGMSRIVTPTVTTTYSVTGTNSSGCTGETSITISLANPDEYASNAGADRSTCSGSGVILTASGGDSYLWSTGETTQNISVNPNSTSTYTVIAYTETVEITDEVTVNVNPQPIVSIGNGSEVTILEGEYVTLSATGANRYEWNNGATLANIAVNPSVSTTFSVIGYIQDCSDVKEVMVNVVPKVVAFAGENHEICRNESVTLTATGGDEFLWSTGETSASIEVTPTEDTQYSVTVYNDLDYDTAEVMVYVNDCNIVVAPDTPDELEEPEVYELLVYPNPTSGNLNIKISGVMNVTGIAMFDLSGKMLFNEVVSQEVGNGFERTLDLSKYSDGLYILKLMDHTRTITKKIAISR